jgi:tetratricopeptide (TPR) repeat protein
MFTKQFDRLNQVSHDISNLLKLLSFLDPEKISVEMLVKGAKELLHPHYPPQYIQSQPINNSPEFRSLVTLITSPVQFPKAIQTLQKLSLIEHRYDAGTSLLWMHDLIRFMMQEGARKGERYREWLQSSVSLICAAFRNVKDPDLPQSWTEYEEFEPHLRSLNQRWNGLYGVNLELVGANVVMAKSLWHRGRYNEAEVLFKEVVKSYETEFGCEHPSTVVSMNDLAFIYNSQGRYGDAEALHKQALALQEKHLGADHLSTLASIHHLAIVHTSQGRYDDAEALHKRALAGYEKHLGADHPTTLASIHDLAIVYCSQRRYDEAEALYKQALTGCGTQLGTDHPRTRMVAKNLAKLHRSRKPNPLIN